MNVQHCPQSKRQTLNIVADFEINGAAESVEPPYSDHAVWTKAQLGRATGC